MLANHLQWLSLCDIVIWIQQLQVRFEKGVIVLLQELRTKALVLHQHILEKDKNKKNEKILLLNNWITVYIYTTVRWTNDHSYTKQVSHSKDQNASCFKNLGQTKKQMKKLNWKATMQITTHTKSRKCIRGDVEVVVLDILEEVVKLGGLQHDPGQRLVSHALP